MNRMSNFHTHTSYCDGKSSPEELVQEAIRLGCPCLGFSGHSYTAFDESCCMSKQGTEEYKAEIRRLREKYRGQIELYLGIEQDYYSDMPTGDYDYVIGGVHYLFKHGVYFSIDADRVSQKEVVDRHYGGDWYALAEDYYDTVSRLYERTGCDIVAHFDLITKFNGDGSLFFTGDERYRRAAMKALDSLIKTPVVFEINTGAVSRGYRNQPYPEPWILDYLKKRQVKIIWASDCHRADKLLYGFPEQ